MNLNLMIIVAIINALQNGANAITSLATGLPAKDEIVIKKSCLMDRVYRMIAYDCSHMDAKKIPENLKTSVEFLDITFNRIRELNKNSFARYTDIKLLYLQENMIQTIDADTFSHLIYLEVIDLSFNGLTTIPLELFQLPALRTLRASENNLKDLGADLQKLAKPIKAPLQLIELGYTKLSTIPDFGILPKLDLLNVTGNPLSEITPQQFSPFCSLKSIDIENATDMEPCACQAIKVYLQSHSITLKYGLDCSTIKEDLVYCPDTTNATKDSPSYDECKIEVKRIQASEEAKKTWFTIICSLAVFFVIFIGVLYYFHRRNVKHTKEKLKTTQLRHIHQTENGNVEVLLNSKT